MEGVDIHVDLVARDIEEDISGGNDEVSDKDVWSSVHFTSEVGGEVDMERLGEASLVSISSLWQGQMDFLVTEMM